MTWSKRVTLCILSVFFITLISCESTRNKPEAAKEEIITKEDLVSDLFKHVQNWNDLSIPLIDSIGFQISQMDSTLTFLPYSNEYEPKSFVFQAAEKEAFRAFEESDFLSQSKVIKHSTYKVWRKELNELQILDLSIEPHPTLNWVFIVRLRGQE